VLVKLVKGTKVREFNVEEESTVDDVLEMAQEDGERRIYLNDELVEADEEVNGGDTIVLREEREYTIEVKAKVDHEKERRDQVRVEFEETEEGEALTDIGYELEESRIVDGVVSLVYKK